MKTRYTIFTFLFLFLTANASFSQLIGTVSFSPSVPLVCNPITVTTNGSLLCANAMVLSSSNSFVAGTLYVDIQINQPFICLPAIVPFMQNHTITNAMTGSYSLVVRTYLNGTLSNTSVGIPITIGSCCSVNTNFTLSSAAICPGDSISFSASNASLPSYGWKIDGTPLSGGQNTGSRFTTPGNYQIRLVGNDTTCVDSTERTIQVASFPIIAFPAPVMENCPGSMDGMIATQVSGGLRGYSYLWSNGDTSAQISQLAGGLYSLTVTDSIGCASTDSIMLATGPAVVAQYAASNIGQVCPGETVSFANISANATLFNWLKDGQLFSQVMSPNYTFNDTGTFMISLIADDGPGCVDTFTQTVTVIGPTASFTSSVMTRACPNEEILLTNTSQGASILTWQSGGASFANTSNASISFSQQNTYDITLIASDGSCADTSSININISAPTANFIASLNSPICPGEMVSLTNTSVNNLNNNWLANGQSFSNNSNATYTFNDPGMVNIKLIIQDDRCFDSTEQQFMVNALPSLSVDQQDENCEGDQNGSISLTLAGGVAPFTYSWSNSSTMKDVANLAPGSYSLIIRDADGCELMDTFDIVTLGGLTANFATTQMSNGIQFTDLSDSTAVDWLWDFGDGNFSSDQSPLHSYTNNGQYIICMTATDQFGCSDTVCDTVSVATSIGSQIEAQIQFYPNPTRDKIYFHLSHFTGEQAEIKLFDAQGKTSLHTIRRITGENQLSISHLPTGLYIVQIQLDDRRLMGKVMVIK